MIDVRGVHFTYPSGTQALKGVDLKIEDGEFVAIMGENGAGKTTLIKHLNGIFKPSKGKVSIDDVDTRDSTIAEISKKVGLVFQNPDHLLFSETVEEEVAFALAPGETSEVVESMLGFHIVQVLEREERPVSPKDQAALQDFMIQQWVEEMRAQADIERYVNP